MTFFTVLFLMCAALGFFMTPEEAVLLPDGKKSFRNVRADAIYLLVCFVPLCLICGLREVSIGADTDDYVASFLDPEVLRRTVGGQAKFELGYVAFVKFVRLFSDSPHVFLMLTAVVCFLGKYFFIKYNCSGNYVIALLMYIAFLYYVEFSALRQAMAISIAINSMQFLRRKQIVPAILFIVAGALFHTTALLLLVMIPFMFGKNDKAKIIIAVILAVSGVLLFDVAVNLVLKIFPVYERYWDSELMIGEGGIGIFALLVMMLSAFSATMLFFGKD